MAIIRSFFIHLLYMNIALYWKDVTCVFSYVENCLSSNYQKNTKKVGVDS